MKKLYLICLLVLTSIFSTGCVRSVMRFNPDGSGSFEIGFNMSIQNLQEAQELSGEGSDDDLDGLLAMIRTGKAITDEESGLSVGAQERLENGSIWTYVIVTVPTIDDWALLEDATGDIFSESDTEEFGPADPNALAMIPDITISDSTIRIEMSVPSSADSSMAEDDPFGMAAIMGAFIQLSYEIEMPGELIEHNGQIDTLTGNPVWLVDFTSTDDLEIVVESGFE